MAKQKNSDKNVIHNPHDAMFFHALQNYEVARDAIRAYLAKDILPLFDLNRIEHYNNKIITDEFQKLELDIIYKVPFKDKTALVLFHLEHQSTVDSTMPLRVWRYVLSTQLEYYKNHKDEPLPIVIPIVVYSGEEKYTKTMNYFDLFGEHKDLAKKYILADISLVDVCRLDDEDINKHHLLGLVELAFKYKNAKEMELAIKKIFQRMHELALETDPNFRKFLLKYIAGTFNETHYEKMIEISKMIEYDELGEEIMTMAQQLRQEGIQQGRQEEKLFVAQNMFESGFSLDQVENCTKLPKKTLSELFEEIKKTKK